MLSSVLPTPTIGSMARPISEDRRATAGIDAKKGAERRVRSEA